jgi:hypothetical protein
MFGVSLRHCVSYDSESETLGASVISSPRYGKALLL